MQDFDRIKQIISSLIEEKQIEVKGRKEMIAEWASTLKPSIESTFLQETARLVEESIKLQCLEELYCKIRQGEDFNGFLEFLEREQAKIFKMIRIPKMAKSQMGALTINVRFDIVLSIKNLILVELDNRDEQDG